MIVLDNYRVFAIRQYLAIPYCFHSLTLLNTLIFKAPEKVICFALYDVINHSVASILFHPGAE